MRRSTPQKTINTLAQRKEGAVQGCKILGEVGVDKDIVAKTTCHYEAMKQFMIAKVFPIVMLEERQFQCVNHTTNRVYDTADQEPQECCMA